MAFKEISYKSKLLTIHKAITCPDFDEKTVLVTNTWDYIDLWLKRAGKKEARFYWNQARSFYDATLLLPKVSAPLTAYYCFLNATKALLITKGVDFTDQHGVSGYTIDGQTSLSNEMIIFKNSGILSSLCSHLGETTNNEKYSLKALLGNIPNIHRAYNLTYSSSNDIFIPIKKPKIVKSMTNDESWFCAELPDKFSNQHTINKLPNGFIRDLGVENKYTIRSKKRFKWKFNDKKTSLGDFIKYHMKLRKDIFYINGASKYWYIKRGGNIQNLINRSTMTIMFAAMHKLSEMSRYTPNVLSRHFECQHNWLLSEFISSAPNQFIDEISSEITGLEFMLPGRN
ncbi:YaaC family protein [Morganella morganii subsp. sibonii]